MFVADHLERVRSIHETGVATEHSYRSTLESLFSMTGQGIIALNEPRAEKVGRPDFAIRRGVITVGHCEAKDIGLDITPRAMKDANREQFERYRKALPNLVYTNCLDFRFYKHGELIREISIADYMMGIQPKPEAFEPLAHQLRDFVAERPQTITSSRQLAEMMAGKAALLKDILGKALGEDTALKTELAGQFKAFQDQLIHDLTPGGFADIYAETIAYGMFAARLHDRSPGTFSREEALRLLPKSNPFLRNLFTYVAGPNLDDALRVTVDELAEIFQATDLTAILSGFGKFTARTDPFIHFYETFLAEYNPKKRKARGVWYTPEPVVNFIVRAVDDVLKTEFGLADGLADTSRVTIDVDTGQSDAKGRPITLKEQVHRVQVLDPATGTGTFLAEVIKQVAPRVKGIAPGMWSDYIEKDLIPRLHGFELLMASYAMCHIKIDMMLEGLGYKPSAKPPRLNVYLTNSLEEGEREVRDLFMARWLNDEARGANAVKRDKPIMCVIGNPPYSGESANKGDWIMGLMDAYKKEPGGKVRLNERNPKWINDDYVKFIRFAEHMIEKNGEGVLGFITAHGYLSNPTFRGMRWHLMNTFDEIRVIDLHGNANRKEVCPDGSADKNVFDIKQGVAIVVAYKKADGSAKKSLARLKHGDIWGDRKSKSKILWREDQTLAGTVLQHHARYCMFYPIDNALLDQYDRGFALQTFMPVNSVGIVTARDALSIDMDRQSLWERVQDFASTDAEVLRSRYSLGNDVRDWRVEWAKQDVNDSLSEEAIIPISYRPFDTRWTFYTGRSRGFHCYPRGDVMDHLKGRENLALITARSNKNPVLDHFFVSRDIAEAKFGESSTQSAAFPLYLYPDEGSLDQTRRVNMAPKIRRLIERAATPKGGDVPDEVAIFDYIYGVLHCPAYRETYAEFLKIDFPRIPYPPSPEVFADVSAKGTALRRLHLMEADAIGETPYPYAGEGDNIVVKPEYREGVVWINEGQSFAGVPIAAWDFHIGGYQPAQKWLKDRKGRALDLGDVRHYQRIVKILSETDRIMGTIAMPLGADQPPASERR